MEQQRTFLLIDTMNMAFRARHSAHNRDIDTQIGMSMHVMLQSIASCAHRFGQGSDVYPIFCFEGHSWRKLFYAPYKANRAALKLTKTEKELEMDDLFLESINDFKDFVTSKTNATCLQHKEMEADDFIAFWIQAHPDDKHIIVSTDTDYKQCINENVSMYDGVRDFHHTIDGVFDKKGQPATNTKGDLIPKPEPEYELFTKCVRGDKSDNIFPAYPGAREKSTKKKVGIKEAFEDRHDKGFAWNNFMLNRWVNADGKEVVVRDEYNRNVHMVDLTAQPDHIKEKAAVTIAESYAAESVGNVGFSFMKFCQLWDLKRIGEKADFFAQLLNKKVENIT